MSDFNTWNNTDMSLPELNQWCLVMVDRNEGDYWDRWNKPRFEVFAAQLYDIDSEGYGSWRRWVMSDGGPMGLLRNVSWWMPYPEPFQTEANE